MLNPVDQAYHTVLQQLVDKAQDTQHHRTDRTGTGTVSIFGLQMRFNLAKQFPLLTTKRVAFKAVATELNWFLRGDTNIKYLLENNVHIWTDWRYKEYKDCNAEDPHGLMSQEEFEQKIITDNNFAEIYGDIGKGYGHQWRNFGEDDTPQVYYDEPAKVGKWRSRIAGFDQIAWVINEIKTNPMSRRLIISGWNPHELNQVDLPPCHTLFQFFVETLTEAERRDLWEKKRRRTFGSFYDPTTWKSYAGWVEYFDSVMLADGIPAHKLSCQLYQRSADIFLGVPFNIASYALLTHIIATECGMSVGDFVWSGGDVHLYLNHIEQAQLQLSRDSVDCIPQLTIQQPKAFDTYHADDFLVHSYYPHAAIKAPVAV